MSEGGVGNFEVFPNQIFFYFLKSVFRGMHTCGFILLS